MKERAPCSMLFAQIAAVAANETNPYSLTLSRNTRCRQLAWPIVPFEQRDARKPAIFKPAIIKSAIFRDGQAGGPGRRTGFLPVGFAAERIAGAAGGGVEERADGPGELKS